MTGAYAPGATGSVRLQVTVVTIPIPDEHSQPSAFTALGVRPAGNVSVTVISPVDSVSPTFTTSSW
jgi:hypothetical protein